MTMAMSQYAAYNGRDVGLGKDRPVVIRTKAKIRFIDFVRPDGYWPSPYTLEQTLHVFHWLVQTGAAYRVRNQSDTYGLLSKKPSSINFSEVDPIESLKDLRERFHYVLLSANINAQTHAWREKEKLAIGSERWLTFRHYEPYNAPYSEAKITKAFEELLAAKGTLGTQLNRFHPGANDIKCVRLKVYPRGIAFELDYCYPEDWSGWKETLASSNADEPFNDVLFRAVAKLAELKAGSAEAPK